jgi:hypothetical protein
LKSKYVNPTPEYFINSNGEKAVHGIRSGPRTPEMIQALARPQAQIIIHKFGGPRELARTLKACSDDPEDHYSPSTIYRWLYPRDKGGTGGEIPTKPLQTILRCARLAGVMLTTEDIYPTLVKPKLLDPEV